MHFSLIVTFLALFLPQLSTPEALQEPSFVQGEDQQESAPATTESGLRVRSLKGEDVCKLSGVVFVETVESAADYRIYVEDDEAFAKLRVFQETSPSFASSPGFWYFTDNRNLADFTVSIVNMQAFADFTIFYTDFRSLAGCQNR